MASRTRILAVVAMALAVIAVVLRWFFPPSPDDSVPLSVNGSNLTASDVDALPVTTPTAVQNYAPGALQFGELRLPQGRGPHPVVVVVHGGCWTKGYATLRNTAPIASDLAKHGVATWNIEYRQVGDEGGGWPGTFLDWAAALDHLRVLARSHPLDLSRVAVIGHSAGGHAALWLAARPRLPATSEIRGADPLPVLAAVSIDGPGDLAGFVGFDAQICGQPVVVGLMDGTPAERIERYRQASPQALLPLGVRQFLVASTVLTPQKADDYRALAEKAGDPVEVIAFTDACHFSLIAPGQKPWAAIQRLILERAAK